MDPVWVARPNYKEEPVTETTNLIDINNQPSRSADQITIFEARGSAVLLYGTECRLVRTCAYCRGTAYCCHSRWV